MQFVLVIHEGADGLARMRDAQSRGPYLGAWGSYAGSLAKAGALAGGCGMQPPETATHLAFSEHGKSSELSRSPSGPTELSGFFVIDVADREAAKEWASRAPIAPGGIIEVRPAAGAPA